VRFIDANRPELPGRFFVAHLCYKRGHIIESTAANECHAETLAPVH
jgi:hypothetical protein